MRVARRVFARQLPVIEGKLHVIERAGITLIEGVGKDASLVEIGEAIGRCCESIPEAMRQTIDRKIRREQRKLDRLRDFSSINV